MPTLTIHYATDAERLTLEHAIAYAHEMHRLAAVEPPANVIAACEQFALDAGRKLTCLSVEQAIQARVDALEKKGAPPIPRPRASRRTRKAGAGARS